jgi:hypothetical protein
MGLPLRENSDCYFNENDPEVHEFMQRIAGTLRYLVRNFSQFFPGFMNLTVDCLVIRGVKEL